METFITFQMRKEDFVLTDFLLIQKMKQGNEQAFDTFVRKYYNEILKYCSYHCYDIEYAEDLTQETFIKFFAKLSEYHFQGKTKNYLYTIAGNLCKNHYKKKKDIPVDDEELLTYEMPNDMEQILDKMFIDSAINSLPKELKEVIILYYLDELKITEIAEKLQISVSLTKYRLTNARKQLKFFGREEDTDEKEL